VLALLASVSTVAAQLVKGLLSDKLKSYLPLILFVVMVPLGLGMALYMGRDPVAGALEGLFGFASSVGFYEAANSLPGVNTVFNERGWIAPEQTK
jgi:hypothetical protein